MNEQWVVLLEATADHHGGALGAREVQDLLEALDPSGGALYCADRYTVQVSTVASSPAEALADVLSRWAEAVRRLELPPWKVVRTEVLTFVELKQELEEAQRREIPPPRTSPDAG